MESTGPLFRREVSHHTYICPCYAKWGRRVGSFDEKVCFGLKDEKSVRGAILPLSLCTCFFLYFRGGGVLPFPIRVLRVTSLAPSCLWSNDTRPFRENDES